jgi:hypothetical protein
LSVAEAQPSSRCVSPETDAHPRHPHDLFTTSSRLRAIVAGMQSEDATVGTHHFSADERTADVDTREVA